MSRKNCWINLEDAGIPQLSGYGFRDRIILREDVGPLKYEAETPNLTVINLRSGDEIRIDRFPFVIGKSKTADYTVEGNSTVSRRHLAVYQSGENYIIEDMGSKNFTFVNDVKIDSPVAVKDGDRIRLSDEEFIFRF